MTQFQTVPGPVLDSKLQLPKQPPTSPLKNISIHIGSEVTLELVGTSGVDTLKLAPMISPRQGIIEIKVLQVSPTKQTFTIKALNPGKVPINAEESSGKRLAHLMVTAGSVKNHSIGSDPLDVDLFANVCRGTDGRLIDEIRKVLFNDENNLFNQKAKHNAHPTKGDMTCGMVCKERSAQLFGQINVLRYDQPYHEPLKAVKKRSDVKYQPDTIHAVKMKIISILKGGSPVRVGVLDVPIGMWVDKGPQGGQLTAWRAGGHTVVIVGWSAAHNGFMYVDTWPAGSIMKYNGGIPGEQNPDECWYLGMIGPKYDPDRVLVAGDTRYNILRSWTETEHSFNTAAGNYLEIVAGP